MTRHNLLVFLTIIGLSLTGLIAGPLQAQGNPQLNEQQGFWNADNRKQAALAAVQMLTQPNPYMMAVVRIRARNFSVWHEHPGYDPLLGAPELDPARLALIKDRTAMPDFRGRDPKIRNKVEQATYDLFCQALIFAKTVPLEAFEKSAADNDMVTFGHLYRESNPAPNEKRDLVNRYRGKVIPIQGQLLRLRRVEAPAGVLHRMQYVYEGWIKGPTKNAPPFWVVVADAPEDKDSPTGLLEPAEEMNRPVKFYGYFFKVLPYPAQVGSGANVKTVTYNTPMLIGPTLIVTGAAGPLPPEDKPPEPFSADLIAIVGWFVGIAMVILGALIWWFRKDDRRFRDRLKQYHQTQALEVMSDNPAQTGGIKIEETQSATNEGPELTDHDKAGPALS